MSIVWVKEQPRERGGSGKKDEGCEWQRAFLVRTDVLDESIIEITNSCGAVFGDVHPDDASTFLNTFDTKVVDGTGLLFSVTLKYSKKNPAEEDPADDKPGGMDAKPPVWGGSSSVTTGPVYKDNAGNMMTNSAGDPLEGLEKEFAEEKLTLTQYYASHAQWMPLSKTLTNAVNDEAWNGGAARTWKCQGCSKKLNIENTDGATLVYWELSWEFAYRADGWVLRPWDIGFSQLVDDDGVPSGTGTKRATITGQDKKGTRQPVALGGGVALPAGTPPVALEFFVYTERDFDVYFGEVFTPG